jgi:hypothetical protein
MSWGTFKKEDREHEPDDAPPHRTREASEKHYVVKQPRAKASAKEGWDGYKPHGEVGHYSRYEDSDHQRSRRHGDMPTPDQTIYGHKHSGFKTSMDMPSSDSSDDEKKHKKKHYARDDLKKWRAQDL